MTTCAICLNRINVLDKIKQNVTTLMCRHKFHTTCIESAMRQNRRNCPICNSYVLNDIERSLFKCNNEHQMTALTMSCVSITYPSPPPLVGPSSMSSLSMSSMSSSMSSSSKASSSSLLNTVELYKNRNNSVAADVMMNFILKKVDLTDLFLYALRVIDKELIRKILTTNRLNWHKTVNGIPLLEEVLKIGRSIINIIVKENSEIVVPSALLFDDDGDGDGDGVKKKSTSSYHKTTSSLITTNGTQPPPQPRHIGGGGGYTRYASTIYPRLFGKDGRPYDCTYLPFDMLPSNTVPSAPQAPPPPPVVAAVLAVMSQV